MKQLIELNVNGVAETVMIEPWWNLARVLREELHLTGTKIGCEAGDCGFSIIDTTLPLLSNSTTPYFSGVLT